MSPTRTTLHDVLTLAELERPHWPARRALIPAWHPRNEDPPAGDPPAADPPKDPPADPPKNDPPTDPTKNDDPPLGDAGTKALQEERAQRKAAEKRAKDAEAKVKAQEDAKLSDTQKLQQRADEAEAKVTGATEKLRAVNVRDALAEKGLTGAAAKAAAKLLEGVEFDDDDEPTNLDDAIKAAAKAYGDTYFKGAMPKPKAPKTDGGAGNEDREGPNLTADELKAAKAAGMTPEEYANYKSPQPTLPAKT